MQQMANNRNALKEYRENGIFLIMVTLNEVAFFLFGENEYRFQREET